ncbi:MAG: DUF2313 domain-containing protein [Acidobacterium ailaaui]|nr:DUF2313 domain-containing protein [Pseudacidobacterium ailaaui]
MAVITTGAVSINSVATVLGKLTKITKLNATNLTGQATATGKVIKIVKAAGNSIGATTVNASNFVVIKYGKSSIKSTVGATASAWKYKTISATITTTAMLEAYQTDRDIAQDMHDYLPRYYDDFKDVVAAIQAEASEFTRIQAKLRELLDQFYVESATFGLDRWESLVGIEHIPQRSEISRRHFIEAKLRGAGTTTLARLNDIVNAFYGFETTELPSENAVNFKLVSRRGIPKNLEDIQAAVNDVIPAHIDPRYEFTYLPWNELEASKMRWSDAKEFTWKALEESFLTEGEFEIGK